MKPPYIPNLTEIGLTPSSLKGYKPYIRLDSLHLVDVSTAWLTLFGQCLQTAILVYTGLIPPPEKLVVYKSEPYTE